MVYFRCLNPLTMASHLKASLMLSWWVNIFCFTIYPLTLYFWFYCVFWWVWFFDHDRLYVCVFEMKWHWHPGFVRRVQSSKVEEQKPTDFCLHFNFPGRVAQISVDQGSFFLCRMLFTLLPSWGSTLGTLRCPQFRNLNIGLLMKLWPMKSGDLSTKTKQTPWKVIRVIGRGNFADVQLARERSSGKVFFSSSLHFDFWWAPNICRCMHWRSWRRLARMSPPSIVRKGTSWPGQLVLGTPSWTMPSRWGSSKST